MKKKEEIKELVKEDLKLDLEIAKVKIGLLDAEFGREDLNQLKNKLNEVIDFLNK